MPGNWLLAFARVVFSDTVLSSVIEPTVADMRVEWADAGSRPARLRAQLLGYIAFWSIVAMSPFAFSQHRKESDMGTRTQTQLVAVLLLAGLGAGYLYARMQPVVYKSSAIIQIVQPRVPSGLALQSNEPSLNGRLRSIEATMLSRTRLEKIITEYNLYETDRQRMTMEDIVGRMRTAIDTVPLRGDVFSVAYRGSDPTTVMKVAERLASYFLEESLKDKQRRVEGTLDLLESRIQETASRLTAAKAELEQTRDSASALTKDVEFQVIKDSYRNLLTQREEALGMRQVDRRQLGEQVILLDPAQVPKRPLGPPAWIFAIWGGVAGLLVATMVLLASFAHRLLSRRKGAAGATA
jgi:uncharacterized protein involved in exopolysaccharide biosynthesis